MVFVDVSYGMQVEKGDVKVIMRVEADVFDHAEVPIVDSARRPRLAGRIFEDVSVSEVVVVFVAEIHRSVDSDSGLKGKAIRIGERFERHRGTSPKDEDRIRPLVDHVDVSPAINGDALRIRKSGQRPDEPQRSGIVNLYVTD